MYVWSDGKNHRISMVSGIAYCQVFDAPGLEDGQRAMQLCEMTASARKMIDRGIRPLGLILDLRRTAPITDESGRMALGALLARFDQAQLPVSLLVRDDTTYVAKYLPAGQAAKGRVFLSLAAAESWVRSGRSERGNAWTS